MRDHYEQQWARLPAQGVPFDFERRRRFLLAAVAPGDRVLDAGCGEGRFTAELADAGARPLGVDLAEAAVARARAAHPGLDFRRAGAEELPFEDSAFDVVWLSEVLEHVPDTERAMSELRRVLRTGGLVLITTPAHGRLRSAAIALTGRFERHFDPRGEHLRFYTARSLAELLADFGFEDVRVRAVGGSPGLRRSLHAVGVRAGLATPATPG